MMICYTVYTAMTKASARFVSDREPVGGVNRQMPVPFHFYELPAMNRRGATFISRFERPA